MGNVRELVGELRDVQDQWSRSITARRSAKVWQVLPSLLSRPAVTSRVVQDSAGMSQPAADAVIATLRRAGILQKAVGTHRYVVWLASDVVDALDRFADRAKRRQR